MVRLKAKRAFSADQYVNNFNSNMVRLKVAIPKMVDFEIMEFQFQYGTIKSR